MRTHLQCQSVKSDVGVESHARLSTMVPDACRVTIFAALLAGAEAFAPVPLSRAAPLARARACARLPEDARTRPVALDAAIADGIFGIAFFSLLSLSGILFIKSSFYEAQDEASILEGDPFTAFMQSLPFTAPRMTEEAALQKADEISNELRIAIAEREYPTALRLKRELADLMIDYRLDYNPENSELPDELPGLAPKRPSFLSDGPGWDSSEP